MEIKKILIEENVGGFDLWIRALSGSLAMTALAMDLAGSGIVRILIALIAFAGIFTSITRHCSLYPFFGVNTAEKK